MATIESATSDSISVKPALACSGSRDWYNFNSTRQPIDANLEACTSACEGDRTAARHARRKENDSALGARSIALFGQQDVHCDVAWQPNRTTGCARANDASSAFDLSKD